ncbi:Tol-Pal system beta propeller repeat protein TolB [Carnimonas nigrificans]|uniref:Tol-Pal system beta propeller repeat protein TolB n=1 Tax=Carnimonas nigrificans TaxID=64323 RepID=UPI000470C5D4|nr:Tol-Pal system beta propeller repeat protein TolB [Carnimonas nigrificans]
MRRLAAFTGLFLMLAISAVARADLDIQITRGSNDAIPIAVTSFNANGQQVPQNVSDIITNDLRNSGKFAPLSSSNLIATPAPGDQIDYAAWQNTRASYLVDGRVESTGNGYKIVYELHDVFGNKREISANVTGSEAQLRQSAHYVADQIFEKITGIRGAFRTKIAYVISTGVDPNMSFSLYVADQDGYNPRRVLSSNEPILSPAWSPDGSKLAYVSFEGKRPSIYVQQLATGNRIKLTSFKGINGAPAWSPDGRKLAMSLSKGGSPDIYVMDLGSRQLSQLTHGSSINTEPNYAPDGASLIYTSDQSGQPQIYRYNFGSGQSQRVTFTNRYNAAGHFAPDGSAIFFVTRTSQGFQAAKQDLASGRLTVLSKTRFDEAPTVAPNGTMVVYATEKGGRGILGATSADGRASFEIPVPDGNVQEPSWSPFTK